MKKSGVRKTNFIGLPVFKIIMFLSGENCGLPRPHGLPYTLVYNFSNIFNM